VASVFLSYVRSDLARARSIAQALEKAGHSVWWDRHIAGGSEYSKQIEQALKRAEVVVVLWSKDSIDSAWVRDEAAAGRDKGRLVPATLDGSEAPLGFRQYQTIDMSAGTSRGRKGQLGTLLETVRAVTGDQGAIGEVVGPDATRTFPNRWLFVAVAVALLGLVALFLIWRPFTPRSSVPVVTVTSADSSPQAQAMAQDLLVKLGNLQSTRPDMVELTERPERGDPDLAFAVGASKDSQSARANLVLFDGRTRALLWSKDFERPISQHAVLQQQVAFTAARALECAVQALAGERAGLKRSVAKVYLNQCAETDRADFYNLDQRLPTARQLTAQAPAFEGAWAQLLRIELLIAINSPRVDPALMRNMRHDIVQAREVNPHLPEAYLAEALFLPWTDFAGRLRLVDRAIERDPGNWLSVGGRMFYLRAVGRLNEALESAKREAELDPLSPGVRNDYIATLVAAGHLDRAWHELEAAEQLWPNSSVMRRARFNLELRYGDPKEALRIWRLGVYSPAPELMEPFLRARIDPTPANIEAAVRQARGLFQRDYARLGSLFLVLAAFGREEELFPILLNAPPATIERFTFGMFLQPLRKLRHDPRFMQVAKRLNLLDYWQKSGKWPDFCFEPDLPYDCRKEAAKLS